MTEKEETDKLLKKIYKSLESLGYIIFILWFTYLLGLW